MTWKSAKPAPGTGAQLAEQARKQAEMMRQNQGHVKGTDAVADRLDEIAGELESTDDA